MRVSGGVTGRPGRGAHGLADLGGHEVVHPGIAQTNGEVVAPFAGGDHEPAGQPLEGHVPQPGRVVAVGDAGVDGHHDGRGSGREHVERFLPSGRVLGQQQADRPPRQSGHAVAPGHFVDGGEGRGRPFGISSQAHAAARAKAAFTRLTRPGSAARARAGRRGATIPSSSTTTSGSGRERSQLRAVPRGPLEGDAPRAVGAPGGVGGPAQPGGDPDHVGGGRGRPGDEGIVGVGHHPRGWSGGESPSPALGQLAHLLGAVELVPAEVQEHDRVGPGVGQDRFDPSLVDLEHRGGLRGGRCRGRPRCPGAMLAPSTLDTTGRSAARAAADETGGGRLAVGGADDHDLPAGGELGEEAIVDEERRPPTDHASGAEVDELRGPSDGAPGGHGHAGPGR